MLGLDYESTMDWVDDLIAKTLLSVQSEMISTIDKFPKRVKYFEVYGFDIILDEALRPWLLEINIHPSFQPSSNLDDIIKTSLLTDTMHVLGISCPS